MRVDQNAGGDKTQGMRARDVLSMRAQEADPIPIFVLWENLRKRDWKNGVGFLLKREKARSKLEKSTNDAHEHRQTQYGHCVS